MLDSPSKPGKNLQYDDVLVNGFAGFPKSCRGIMGQDVNHAFGVTGC